MGPSASFVSFFYACLGLALWLIPAIVPDALCAFGGPTLGPLCGSYIQRDAGMRWNMRVMAIFITLTSIGAALVPETFHPTIIKRKLKLQGRSPAKLSRQELVSVFRVALSRPIVYLFTEPICTLVCLYLAVLYGTMYGCFNVSTKSVLCAAVSTDRASAAVIWHCIC